MKKQYCDFCGKETDFELESEVEIYNHALDDNEFQADICEGCKKKIIGYLKTLKK